MIRFLFETDPGPCTSDCDGVALNRCTIPPRLVPRHRICRQLLLRYPISAARVVPILPLELTSQPNFANLRPCGSHYDRGVL